MNVFEELDIIYNALSSILVLLRDNGEDLDNRQMFLRTEQIVKEAREKLGDGLSSEARKNVN